MLLSGVIAANIGWEWVFYIFGKLDGNLFHCLHVHLFILRPISISVYMFLSICMFMKLGLEMSTMHTSKALIAKNPTNL